ncbi:hypothetical protein PACTADRAFT_34678 [Pachysolen tannophilus NRRL Y-2460]|uniref:DNA-binding protein RAP1 n=1 Tax=Pachysolen tannophilus NRRL Y-2460 TaxID=669874 RepID=A0A1E4TTC0_PACTA|nr:hypothetical protein PACTADRAFT_34678 [Pachysolen tannophilus NRRL Y-2460]
MTDFVSLPDSNKESPHKNSSANYDHELFTNALNEPYVFLIPEDEPELIKLTKLIQEEGGRVINRLLPEDIKENPQILTSIIVLTSSEDYDDPFIPSSRYFNPIYVFECIRERTTLNLNYFKLVNPTKEPKVVSVSPSKEAGSKHEITTPVKSKEAPNAKARSAAAATATATAATAAAVSNSASDSAAGTIGEGTPISSSQAGRQAQENLARKNAFTEEEDEYILEEVRKHPRNRKGYTLYNDISKNLKNRTAVSIRSRFKQYLEPRLKYVYQVDSNNNLIKDSNNELIKTSDLALTINRSTPFTADDDYILAKKITESAMITTNKEGKEIVTWTTSKFFDNLAGTYPDHSKLSWRDRYRKFISVYGIQKYLNYYEKCEEADIEPVAVNVLLKETRKDRRHEHPGDDVFQSARASPIPESSAKRRATLDGLQSASKVLKTSNPANSNDDRATDVSPSKVGHKRAETNDLDSKLDKETENDVNDSKNQSEKLQEQQAIVEGEEEVPDVSDDSDWQESEKVKEDKFISSEILSSSGPKAFISRLSSLIDSSTTDNGSEICQLFEKELGISTDFSETVLFRVSGDLSKFTEYVKIYLKTGLNPPKGIVGIFSDEDDEILQNFHSQPNKVKALVKLHGLKTIKFRRKFLKEHYS